jgi:hypothetical protein
MIEMETAGRGPGGKGGFQNYDDETTIDQAAPSCNDLYFKTAPTYRNRAWWQAKSCRLCSDWPAVIDLALDIIGTSMETDLEHAFRIAAEQHPVAAPAKPRPRPTPQTTIEAIMFCVRDRGLSALQEPANKERLARCDKGAIAQIDARISKLKKAAKC